MTFGQRLKQLREGKYSQEELADIMHIHNNTISKWENGVQMPHSKRIAELAKILGTTTAYLLGEDSIQKNTGDVEANAQIYNPDTEIIATGGISKNELIIDDKRAGRVYRLPNDEEGRKLFLTALISGTEKLSNSINGDNNSGNKLGIINN